MTTIDQMIQQAADNVEAEKKSKQEDLNGLKETQFAILTAKLPGEWPALAEHMEMKYNFSDRTVTFNWEFTDDSKCDELQLAPIELRLSSHGYTHHQGFEVWGTSGRFEIKDFSKALLAARNNYAAYKAKINAEIAKPLINSLNWSWNQLSKNLDLERARVSHSELMRLLPDEKERWDKLLASFIEGKTSKQASEKKEADARVEMDRLTEEYKTQYRNFVNERKLTVEKNQSLAASIQPEFDQPYQVYELTYALIARDEEESEKYLETRTTWLSQQERGQDGMYVLISGKPKEFLHPVSVQPFTFKPSEGAAGSDHIEIHEATIYCHTSRKEELASRIETLGFQEIPTSEHIVEPQHFSYGEGRGIRSQIYDEVMHGITRSLSEYQQETF